MFVAVHKKIWEETKDIDQAAFIGYQAWLQFKPHDHYWFCCPICQKRVTPVKKNERTIHGKKVAVVSHFRMFPGSKSGGCASYESPEHMKLKILVASLIENEKITLKIGNTIIPLSSLKFKEIARLPYRWDRTEQKRGNRRADVIFEFEELHPILGLGIVFEIQTSKITSQNKLQRENDWIKNGYSITWLKPSDFTENSLVRNEIVIDNVWFPSSFKIMEGLNEGIDEKKREIHWVERRIQNLIDKINNVFNKKIAEINNMIKTFVHRNTHTCRTCGNGSPWKIKEETKRLKGTIACWYGTLHRNKEAWGPRPHPIPYEMFHTCNNWISKLQRIQEDII